MNIFALLVCCALLSVVGVLAENVSKLELEKQTLISENANMEWRIRELTHKKEDYVE